MEEISSYLLQLHSLLIEFMLLFIEYWLFMIRISAEFLEFHHRHTPWVTKFDYESRSVVFHRGMYSTSIFRSKWKLQRICNFLQNYAYTCQPGRRKRAENTFKSVEPAFSNSFLCYGIQLLELKVSNTSCRPRIRKIINEQDRITFNM